MPIDDGSQTLSKKRELFLVQIRVTCDGTANAIDGVVRLHHPTARDGSGEIVFQGDEVARRFALADFTGAQQTALLNIINAIDTKAPVP